MPPMVFVVMATTGEYSDREERAVCAYASREMAEAHAGKAMLAFVTVAKVLEARDGYVDDFMHLEDIRAALGELDPGVKDIYASRLDYYVLAVPVRVELP